MLKVSRFLLSVLGLFFLTSRVSADSMPLAINNAEIYLRTDQQLVAKVAVCNTGSRYMNYVLEIRNIIISQTYRRNLLIAEESCSTVEVSPPADFSQYTRVGDNVDLLLKTVSTGGYNIYTLPFQAIVQERYTRYAQAKTTTINQKLRRLPVIPAPASHRFYIFRGKVRLANNLAARSALVQVIDEKSDVIDQVYSDKDGRYSFSRLSLNPSKAYRLVVEIDDYTRYSKPLDLRSSTIQDIDFLLQFTQRVDFSYKYLPEGDRVLRDDMTYVQRGSASLYAGNDSDRNGFYFDANTVTNRRSATFYVTPNSNSGLVFFTNHLDSGVIDLGETSLGSVQFLPQTGYKQVGVALKQDHNYAIYDAKLDTYALVHIDRVTVEDNVVYPAYSLPYYPATVPAFTYLLYGRLVDEDFNPVANALVHLSVNGTGERVIDVRTDSNGTYHFGSLGLTRGKEYTLWISETGYSSYAELIDPAARSQEKTIVLHLPRQIDFTYKYNLDRSRHFDYGTLLRIGSGTVYAHREYGKYAGFNFENDVASDLSGGAFYTGSERDGKLKFYGNNLGQGGVIDLGQGSIDSVVLIPGAIYNRSGVEVIAGHNYAIYDQKNDSYAVLHVDRVMRWR